MKKIIAIIIVIVIGVVVYKTCNPVGDSFLYLAEQRVETVLKGIMKGLPPSSPEYQNAVGAWYNGLGSAYHIKKLDEMRFQFNAWLKDGGVKTPIKEYKIDETKIVGHISERKVHCWVLIDGGEFGIEAITGKPLTWLD